MVEEKLEFTFALDRMINVALNDVLALLEFDFADNCLDSLIQEFFINRMGFNGAIHDRKDDLINLFALIKQHSLFKEVLGA